MRERCKPGPGIELAAFNPDVVHHQYTLLRDALPDYLKPVLAMGYFTGMREGEILPLRLDQLGVRDSQVLLDPGTTKNDQPRIVPLTAELR